MINVFIVAPYINCARSPARRAIQTLSSAGHTCQPPCHRKHVAVRLVVSVRKQVHGRLLCVLFLSFFVSGCTHRSHRPSRVGLQLKLPRADSRCPSKQLNTYAGSCGEATGISRTFAHRGSANCLSASMNQLDEKALTCSSARRRCFSKKEKHDGCFSLNRQAFDSAWEPHRFLFFISRVLLPVECESCALKLDVLRTVLQEHPRGPSGQPIQPSHSTWHVVVQHGSRTLPCANSSVSISQPEDNVQHTAPQLADFFVESAWHTIFQRMRNLLIRCTPLCTDNEEKLRKRHAMKTPRDQKMKTSGGQRASIKNVIASVCPVG